MSDTIKTPCRVCGGTLYTTRAGKSFELHTRANCPGSQIPRPTYTPPPLDRVARERQARLLAIGQALLDQARAAGAAGIFLQDAPLLQDPLSPAEWGDERLPQERTLLDALLAWWRCIIPLIDRPEIAPLAKQVESVLDAWEVEQSPRALGAGFGKWPAADLTLGHSVGSNASAFATWCEQQSVQTLIGLLLELHRAPSGWRHLPTAHRLAQHIQARIGGR